MHKLGGVSRRGLVAGSALLGFGAGAVNAQASFPSQPIRVIVPTDPGGAIDGLARVFQRAFEQTNALSQPLVVVNMSGAGGTIGTRAIRDAAADGHTIGLWHDGLVTSRAMRVVDYDHSAFEVIGATGVAELGIATAADGRFKSFHELLTYAKAHPGEVTVAANIGLPVHFVPMRLAREAGVEFRYVQAGGGARRYQSLVGKHTDIAMFSASELIQFGQSGLASILMLSEQRSAKLPDVPTAKELGIDVTSESARIWLAPKGTPADRIARLRDAFRDAMRDERVAKQISDFGLEPIFVEPDRVRADLDRTLAETLPLVERARQIRR
ncbi:Bug family tripartite tricarboxylate transporter substrate binding protein [Falsiroseomonas sp. E2-1-a4]|uniref:Bug family tripartite tricarboxylate transporter substrate binding protein n=1 Tax=Falsiroseomonas sp. E2-1-a4 TaxID=3239299 RepID=UPI003F3482E4